MADEQGSGPPNKRRRPPTTIDVKATEVAPESTSVAEPVEPVSESPPVEAAAEPTQQEPAQPPEPDTGPSAADETAGAGGSNGPGDVSGRTNWRRVAAAGAGALAIFAIALALWGAGAFHPRDDVTPRLAALEQQVRQVSARAGAAEQAMGRLSDLDARIGKAEAAAAAPRNGQADQTLTARVTALETAMRPLADVRQNADAASAAARDAKSRADAAFEAAQKASPPTVTLAQIEALASRVSALEQAAKSAEEKIARTAGADRIVRLAFVAVALRGAVERGEPFAQELAAVKPLVPDAAALAPLEPFAATGVPRTAALARELSQLTGPMLSAAGTAPREGGIFDRIQQNAERLVRIRPINETPGDDAATVMARADAKAQHGDLAGAVSELGALPSPARAPAEAWIKKAQAQLAAVSAARKLADDALGTLGKAAP